MSDLRRLPRPLEQAWNWQLQGACRAQDLDMFFHPENERDPYRAARAAAAKAVCLTCPVLHPCRTHALTVREYYGTWGGMSEGDRELVWSAAEEPPL